MDSRQERKDLALRRRLRRVLGLTAAIGIVLLVVYELWLRRIEAQGAYNPRAALQAMGLAATLVQLGLALVAALAARSLADIARQVREQGQWPPAGLELPGNAPVRYGADALRIARNFRISGVLAIVLATLLVVAVAWRWFN
jgi:hypothetical protein